MTTTATKKPSTKNSTEKSSYEAGVLARQNREPLDSAPGSPDDPLNMEWRRGWLAIRTGECQTPNLLDEIQQAGMDVDAQELDGLNEGQRIEVLDWLDTAPTSETEDEAGLAWDAWHDRAPNFISIEEAASGMLTQIRIIEPPENASGEGENAVTGTLAEGSAESVPPTPEVTPESTSDLQAKFTRQTEHLQAIEEANKKVIELNASVVECESEVSAAKGRLKEAESERDAAVRVLSQIIDDSKSGQGKLFSVAEISAANGVGVKNEVSTPASAQGEGNTQPIIPLSVLSTHQIKKLVGADAFNAAKESFEGPIGLSDKQLEKLEAACESDTLQGLEKWIASNAWWHQKISGFGEAAISKVTSTIMAYRRVHPQVE